MQDKIAVAILGFFIDNTDSDSINEIVSGKLQLDEKEQYAVIDLRKKKVEIRGEGDEFGGELLETFTFDIDVKVKPTKGYEVVIDFEDGTSHFDMEVRDIATGKNVLTAGGEYNRHEGEWHDLTANNEGLLEEPDWEANHGDNTTNAEVEEAFAKKVDKIAASLIGADGKIFSDLEALVAGAESVDISYL